MRLSPRQLEQLGDHGREVFCRRVFSYLRQHYRALCAPIADADLDVQIRHAVAGAEALGLTQQNLIASYVVASLLLGNDFATHPTIAASLHASQGSADMRFASLSRRLSERDWQTVGLRQHHLRSE